MLSVFPSAVIAQNEELTVDRQFELARQAAFEEENYDKARKYAYAALEISPDYHGIRVFVARLYAWEGNYRKAREELHYVLDKDPDNHEALSARLDVASWSENYREGLEWAEQALQHFPQEEDFLLAKARLQQNLEMAEDAEQTYLNILDLYPGSQKARQGLQSLNLKQMKYQATLSYRHDRFSEIFEPWNFWEVQLSRQTTIGSVIGRVQYANRFSTNGVQVNADAYPSITEGLYSYVSAGFSNSFVYPDFRLGLSLYKTLPSSFEVEGGFRYLNFSSSNTSIYILALSKYWGNYLFTGRTYIVPSSAGNSQSLSLLTRRYFSDAQTYLGIRGGFGTASADFQFSQDIQRLDSWSFSVEGQYPINRRFNIGGNAGFDSEEFANFTRDRFSFKLYLSYRF
ncbi:YaiO family outer membrane beta-barrel protein [Balneolaceae bacterium YR4-1]|uniref:YaiO family outer membrane beta-barrel protein n=1 Tax=Halalkalibaculum roseum TaxID=2709311 RepID=A0A6M1SS69_9BACT|nr:YaiO family outer membrane beta-barrel protein [Halalkalibaculum roseum]NGP75592.1 YaiO family outer membrane beta-barrel protein [Halalkalibaculum roseum]